MHSLILMSRIGPGYCWWSVAKTHFFVIWNFLKFYEINSSNISIFFYLIKKKIVVDKIYQYLTFFTERRYFPIQLKYIFNQSKFAFDKDDFIRFPEIFLQVWEIFFHSKKIFFCFSHSILFWCTNLFFVFKKFRILILAGKLRSCVWLWKCCYSKNDITLFYL